MRTIVAVVALAVGLVLGASLGVAWAEDQAAPAAYVVVGGRTIDASGLEAYGEVAGPPARAAGIEMLARGEGDGLHLVEGTMPTGGFIAVERFRSLDDFLGFWNSEAYQQAIELRKGKVELDFVVALEAVEAVEAVE